MKDFGLVNVESNNIDLDFLKLLQNHGRKYNFYKLDWNKHGKFIAYLNECASKNTRMKVLNDNFFEIVKNLKENI